MASEPERARTRLVNGKRVPVPAAEAAALESEWNAWKPEPPPETEDQRIRRIVGEELKAKGLA